MKKLLTLICAIFILTGCTKIVQDEIPYISYDCAQLRAPKTTMTFQGFIDRGLDVELSFSLSGIMNKTFAEEGEFVKKGKLLAKLDNEEYKLQISRAKTELEEAYIKYNRANSYFESVTKLYKAGGISFNDWEEAQTNLKTGANQIKILNDALKITKDKEKFSNIYAPYDGYVIKVYKDDMQFVSSGEKVILFQGLKMPEARVFASQNDINKVQIGEDVILTADIDPKKEYKGKIKSKVNSSINEGAYRVTISITDEADELLDGMSVNVYLADKVKKCKIFVPTASVVKEGDKSYLYILEKTNENMGIAHKREVEIGEVFGEAIEIKSGLQTGENFITEGVNKIMDGSKVKFL